MIIDSSLGMIDWTSGHSRRDASASALHVLTCVKA